MKINQIISEAITTPYPYEMGMDNAQFHDKQGNSYYVRFDDFGDSVWSVAFNTGIQPVDDLTNRQDAFRVLSTVISIIKEWANSAKPKALIFSANRNSESRISLYAKLAKAFTKNSPYEYIEDVSDIDGFFLPFKIKSLINSVPQEKYKTYIVLHRSLKKGAGTVSSSSKIELDERKKKRKTTKKKTNRYFYGPVYYGGYYGSGDSSGDDGGGE